MTNFEKYSDDDLLDLCDANIKEELMSRGYEYGWHKKVQYAGAIYIFVNPAFPTLVKLGYSSDVPYRLKQLNKNSGLPKPYHAYAIYMVKKPLVDLKLHTLIESLNPALKYAPNREFYEMPPEKAYAILSAIAEINGDEDLLIINPYRDEFFSENKQVTDVLKVIEHPKQIVPDGSYYLERKMKSINKKIKATVRVEGNKWIVEQGSMVCPVNGSNSGIPPYVRKARKEMVVVDNILQNDAEFSSPSSAACFVVGVSCGGWYDWHLPDGRPIDIYRKKKG